MRIVRNFDFFTALNEENRQIPSNIIIGDSLSPLVDKNTSKASLLGSTGNEKNLWKGGMGVSWLKGAVDKFPAAPGVKNVIIQIGTNGGFNPNDNITGLISSIKKVFPNAKLYVIQGSWGWGGNKNVTIQKVTAYYNKFKDLGVVVVEPPIGFSATDSEAHRDKESFKKIGKNLDAMLSGQSQVSTDQYSPNSSEKDIEVDSSDKSTVIYKSKRDPYYYKIINDIWFAKGPKLKEWTSLENNSLANRILDKRYPGARSGTEQRKYKDPIAQIDQDQNKISGNFIGLGSFDPEKEDAGISKTYNIHLIPDNLSTTNPNYRSAQMPLKELKYFLEKYGVKRVIRLNGDGGDGRHRKSDPSTSIQEEKNLCKSLGIEFNKLSSTKDQEKVNEILSKGNTLIHCAHGADRTGGNVGGYFYTKKVNPNLDSTEEIWNYTTKYNGWNKMVKNNPDGFSSGGYLKQAQKFGVKNLDQAKSLAG